jgi:lysozyme
MKTSVEGLALIKKFEGFSAKPYLCPAGRWTIGYGHVMTANERATYASIGEDWAERWLEADVVAAEHAVQQLISVPLEQNQFDALVSFTFNLGTGALQRSVLRRAINRAEKSAIPTQWMRWVRGGGKKLPGLVTRRAAELALYL